MDCVIIVHWTMAQVRKQMFTHANIWPVIWVHLSVIEMLSYFNVDSVNFEWLVYAANCALAIFMLSLSQVWIVVNL